MSVMQFTLPDPGEGLVEAEIVTWHVAPGDSVDVNQVVLEIETAKSLVELPIPWAGTVASILVAEGETVEVGTPIVTIDCGGDAPASDDDGAGESRGASSPSPEAEAGIEPGNGDGGDVGTGGMVAAEMQTAADVAPDESGDEPQQKTLVGYGPTPTSSQRRARHGRRGVLASPATRGLARTEGVDLADVTPTRDDGVISRDDVQAHSGSGRARHMRDVNAGGPGASGGAERVTVAAAAGSTPPSTAPGVVPGAPSADDAAAAARSTVPQRPTTPTAPAPVAGLSDERIPIKGVRKVTAQAMVSSAFTAPHVTEFLTVDMTRTMEFVRDLGRDREFRDIKVTPLLVVAKACLLAMKREPMMNALWDEAAGEIVMRSEVNLGIAAATERGLLVPNVKDASRFALADLGREIAKLIDVARHGKPSPAILNGGTFTISNIGVFGVDAGTPIIKPGESGILAIGTVRPMPWVVENAAGEQEMVIRQIAQLSLSFDHRIIDGDVGSRFLASVGQLLENPAKALAWS